MKKLKELRRRFGSERKFLGSVDEISRILDNEKKFIAIDNDDKEKRFIECSDIKWSDTNGTKLVRGTNCEVMTCEIMSMNRLDCFPSTTFDVVDLSVREKKFSEESITDRTEKCFIDYKKCF